MESSSRTDCILCHAKTSILSRTKLNNGTYLCSNCTSKVGFSQNFTKKILKTLDCEGIQKRIEFHDQDMKGNAERIEKFNPTYKVGAFIWFDDEHKYFVLPKQTLFTTKIDNCYIFNYDDIISFDLINDEKTVTDNSGTLGRAVLGEQLFGTAGAIRGALSQTTSEMCSKLQIKITTRDPDVSILYINLIDYDTNKDSLTYDLISEQAQEILSKLQIIVSELEEEKIANTETTTFSVADEIKKFKELLDDGAITQEEFDKKKKELLDQ